MITLTIKSGWVLAKFRGDAVVFKRYTSACKQGGLSFSRDSGGWVGQISCLPFLVDAIRKGRLRATMDDESVGELSESYSHILSIEKKVRERVKKKGLFPYQLEGVQFLATRDRCGLFDDMGLGKTVQALCAIPDDVATMVVCPAIAKGSWVKECAKWRPDLNVTVIKKRNEYRVAEVGEVVILNYELLPSSSKEGADVLIEDEAQYTKKYKSKRTRAFRSLAKRCGKVWLLTGTPLENKPPDLWGVLQGASLGNRAFGSYKRFIDLHGGEDGQFGIEWTGNVHPDASTCLSRVCLRRTKQQVLSQLPTKRYRTIEVELPSHVDRDCTAAIQGLDLEGILDWKDGDGIASLSYVRRELAEAKIPAMLKVVESYEENEEKLIVFSHHRGPIDAMLGRPGWGVITGDTPHSERDLIVQQLQDGILSGVAATIQAAGTAITLTAAAHMLMVDKPWVPSKVDQAEDRICRIGQDRGCMYTSLVADHDIDRAVESALMRKRVLINETVEKATSSHLPMSARLLPILNHAREAMVV